VHTARANKHSRPNTGIVLYEEDDLPGLLENHPTPLLLILDCVQDPHNFGACLRTADGAGVAAVIVPKDKSAPLTDTVLRVSCGGAEHVPIVRVVNMSRCMEKLKKLGVWLVGTSDQGKQSIYDVELKGPIGIVMGAEGEGMRRLTEEKCDFLVQIPMAGTVPCLNVSVATGVCLFEAVRQRAAK
jgi:23S rRNA (guanosine2251-2'-O)-methyltransferase